VWPWNPGLQYDEGVSIIGKGFLVLFSFFFKKIKRQAGCQWLMPGILATQEAEIRRISV
jgi:hypothetical protein